MPKIPKVVQKRDLNSQRTRPTKLAAWDGPISIGVTQSMLSNYLQCKERFRVKLIDGLSPVDELSIPLEFGNLWHLCEERLAAHEEWEEDVKEYADNLILKHPGRVDDIVTLYNACLIEFAIYVQFWSEHEDVITRTPLLQEKNFRVEYDLPSGRTVLLRGKWDAIDLIGERDIFLQENKSKTGIQIYKIKNQLKYDLQVMVYLIAMEQELVTTGTLPGVPKRNIPSNFRLAGVRYNVVMRALSGGVGTIKRKRKTKLRPAENDEDYYERLRKSIVNHKDEYFKRWKVVVSAEDRNRFKKETLDPLLENLCDDYEWWAFCKLERVNPYDYEARQKGFPHHVNRHFRLPYGIYHSIAEGGYGKLDNYINEGTIKGLVNNSNFFPELE